MEKNYDVLEFYKIINELIDLSRLEKTKEKFLEKVSINYINF